MKIALPSRDNMVDGHFGHCEYFTVITVNDSKEIVSTERVDPPAGCGCKSNIVVTLSEMGVTLMLAGNMGQGAVNVLGSAGIEVVRGCAGDVTEVTKSFLNGTLVDNGVACAAHEHGYNCHKN
jgi:predicted Fe-Mo cluster-binding NifX family protein